MMYLYRVKIWNNKNLMKMILFRENTIPIYTIFKNTKIYKVGMV